MLAEEDTKIIKNRAQERPRIFYFEAGKKECLILDINIPRVRGPQQQPCESRRQYIASPQKRTRRRVPKNPIIEVGYYLHIPVLPTRSLLDIDTIKRCASDGSVPASHSFQPNQSTYQAVLAKALLSFPVLVVFCGRYQCLYTNQNVLEYLHFDPHR